MNTFGLRGIVASQGTVQCLATEKIGLPQP